MVEDGAVVFKVKAFEIKGSTPALILKAQLKTEGIFLQTEGALILQFQLGTEKYISQNNYLTTEDEILLDLNSALFRIQRRQDFRIRIPSSIKTQIRLKNPADRKMTLVDVFDLSGGGCRLQYSAKEIQFHVQQKFTATLEIDGREPFILNCMVQHQNPDPEKKDAFQAGIQFINLDEKVKNKIISLVMDIYKEYMKK